MNEIFYIANKLDKNWAKSFKQLGNQVKALTKNKYIQDVLPNIQSYYVTEKADGLRCFLMISDKYIKYITSENVNYMQIENSFSSQYIFDSELIDDTIYIFDVIIYNNENVSNNAFKTRYELLEQFKNILLEKKVINIKVKIFYKLDIATYQNNINNIYKMQIKHKYKVDGLIFIEINMSYNKTINLKWKPAEFLTIDFLAVKVTGNKYILSVGIDAALAKSFNLIIDEKYKDLVNFNNNANGSYIPVPFYNSLLPNIYNYTHLDNTDLNNQVIELSLDKHMQWKFHRIRYDRQMELQTGNYYGNNYKVAETTLASILNPLLLKELIAPYSSLIKNVYFTKQDTSYKAVKQFNNYVKNLLISKYYSESVIDLASGRGGDINKYVNANVQNILMVEVDVNAIEELINRKYLILPKTNKSCNIIALNIDLNKNYLKNISLIESSFINNNMVNVNNKINKPCKVVFCHFAMHYMLTSEKSAQNIMAFITHYLEKNGIFIITIFNGQKVFDLLKQNKGLWKVDKYMIKYKGKQPSIFAGFANKIDVLLPLSSVPYEEPLIDLLALDKICKKNNIYRSEERNFSELLHDYTFNNFTESDKIFISLYKYVIYTKY